ncbi:DEAD/DEAH box helicase [Prevotella copri]|uniref:DEAD/DEAH box helicase n=1 Tax=Segatella copri TaxID=165179 RepID=A0AB35Z9H6_9BACT|nr:DEAD/DEAH box helicase [Segatella copri]MQN41603.1 DEAD/DEAH box helicase [Segatella copri]MQN47488.1 DEAD/DEAH box helicase [Segatella copri]MQN66935.1 DEAD/DEAH box helicase [Segatella copri]MQN72531.1 DEAD/DEAH box helicase [Segatella copri]MQN86694.1 DEAD/DEAH box helicase [Segatella copri]
MKEIKLFDYQEDMKERIEKALRLHRSVMAQMPTGTGKTVLLASVVESFLREHSNCNVWIVAHRRELVSQIQETIERVFFESPRPSFQRGLHFLPKPLFLRKRGCNRPTRCSEPLRSKDGGPSKVSPDCAGWDRLGMSGASKVSPDCLSASAFNVPIKAVSIQWLSKHYDEIEEEPGMIVIDEAHHALAKTYKGMWDRFPKAKFLGLTATPCRLNGKGFTDLFDVLVQSWSVPEFISKGRLATYDFVSIKSDGVTQRLIDSLQKRGADGDYQNKEMDMLLNKKPSIERLYQSLEEFGKDRKGIVYAINISHAQKITKLYQENGVKAIAIDSKTPATERQQDIEAFKKGDIQVLVNVDIFSEGFDCPDVEFVQLARPTLSLAKYLQMVGRGLRVAKGKKNCVIIDNVGLYRVFGLPSQVWNWNAMFEGKLKVGKRKETPKDREFFLMNGEQDDIQIHPDSEMMMVMSHEELLQTIQYREFVDSRGEFAIIKLPDGKMTVVNRQGEQVLEPGDYYDMKLLDGNILFYRHRRKEVCYYDLLSGAIIDDGPNVYDVPKVVTLEGWEFIKYGDVYMSRTYEHFSWPYCPSKYDLFNFGDYLIYRYNYLVDSGCQEWYYYEGGNGLMMKATIDSNRVCFLRGDYEHVYWMCATLRCGCIVVMDSKQDYYLVDSYLKKTYIGCNNPKNENEDLHIVMPRLGKKYYDEMMLQEKKKEASEMILLHEKSVAGHVELYQAGKKWGIKVDGRVVVPPLYRSIAQPVGAYCAFEEIPRYWGIMTLKGKVIVDAKYEKVEIHDGGIAVVTDITGKTQTIYLK